MQGVEEIKGDSLPGNGINRLMPMPEPLMGGNQQRDAQGQALGLPERGIKPGIAAVGIPVPQGGDGGPDDLHGGHRLGKHPEDHRGLNGQGHGAGEPGQKDPELGHSRQASIPKQVGHLFKGTHLRKLGGVIAPIDQAALLAIDKTDF